jgi:hypothetical protein
MNPQELVKFLVKCTENSASTEDGNICGRFLLSSQMNHSPPFTNLKKSRSSFHWLRTSNRAVPGIWVMQIGSHLTWGPSLGEQPHSQPFNPNIICYNIIVDNNRKFYILSFYCISGLTHDVGCMDLQGHLNMKNSRKNSCHQHPTRIGGTPLSYTVQHIL